MAHSHVPIEPFSSPIAMPVMASHKRSPVNNWQSPSGHKGNLPNEMFFVRRIEFSPKLTTGLELRSEEDEFIGNQTKPPFLNQGN